jgi:hypothetical protein
MIDITTGIGGRIWDATSDDGRIKYFPIANGRIQIDGRDCWRGAYRDAVTHYVTDELVEDTLWAAACAFMREVRDYNEKISDALREAAFARQDERAERADRVLALRGFSEPGV